MRSHAGTTLPASSQTPRKYSARRAVLTLGLWLGVLGAGAPAHAQSAVTIAPGESVILQWTTADATTVTIDQGIGPVAASGSQVVAPLVTTTYTLTAVNATGSVTSTVTVTVAAANVAPTVAVTSPAAGATFPSPASVTLTAAAADPDGTVTDVRFFVDGTLVGTATAPPYTAVWTETTPGPYTLTAIATDNLGAQTTAAAVTVTVATASNTPPTVSLTSPTAGTTLTAPATVTLTATASDPDGAVSDVGFFVDGTLVGTATAPPYTAVWTETTPGTYSFTATATDDAGAQTTADSVTVTVVDPGEAPPFGITITPTSGLTTTERGGTAAFTVVLNSKVKGKLTIGLSSSDPTEGTVSPRTLTFKASNALTPQVVTLTGVNDGSPDGLVDYTIVTAPAVTNDWRFAGLDPPDVRVRNRDDDTYYLAEGTTGPFFDYDLLLANPNPVAAPFGIDFLSSSGTTVVQTGTLPPHSQRVIRVNDIGGLEETAVGTEVASTAGLPLVVERSMFWATPETPRLEGAQALPPTRSYYGGHGDAAVTSPHTRWLFSEGSQGFFDTFVLLMNTNDIPATGAVTFLVEGGAPVVKPFVVEGRTRLTLFAGQIPELQGRSFGIVVEANRPIIAERAMYFGTGTRLWEGGHVAPGVPDAATTWFHADGATGPFFDTFLLVSNPNGVPANLTVTYLFEFGATITRLHQVAPNSRLTISVESEDQALASANMSITVTSDVPVASERSMYWAGGADTWYDAHSSFGVTATGTRWGLSEGRVGGPLAYATYLLLANPSVTTAAEVQVTFLRSDGTTVVKPFAVAPASRLTVAITPDPGETMVSELVDEGFGAVIEVANGTGITVERSMYWTAPGEQHFTGGTNATAARLP